VRRKDVANDEVILSSQHRLFCVCYTPIRVHSLSFLKLRYYHPRRRKRNRQHVRDKAPSTLLTLKTQQRDDLPSLSGAMRMCERGIRSVSAI